MKKTERDLIAALRQRSRRGASRGAGKQAMVAVSIGDDAAVLRPRRGEDLVVTTDLSLEGVHFRRDWHPPESVGHRCLARGLSDLAAMGAQPEAAFLSLALPQELTSGWLDRFLEGFFALAGRHKLALAGGDMAQSPGSRAARGQQTTGLVVADIVLVGSVPKGRALLRSGAKPGDVIFVTGALGGSAAELRLLEENPKSLGRATAGVGVAAAGGHPHLYPEARLAAGRWLVVKSKMATAAIDISDGLSTDLAHLCEESGVSAELDASMVPVDARATLEDALHGGEDYELLFTAGPKAAVPAKLGGTAVQAIGRMKRRGTGPLITLRTDEGKPVPLELRGWQHFERAP